MRILYLLQNLPYPPVDGVRIKVFELLRYMQDRHECSILCFSGESHATVLDFQNEVPNCRVINLFPQQVGRRLQIKRAHNLVLGRPVFLARWQSSAFTSAVEKAMAEEQYNLVHLDALGMVPYLRLCHGVPTVISTTDAVSLSERRAAACITNPVQRWYRRSMANLTLNLERSLLPYATKVHVVSPNDSAYLAERVPGIDVCPIELAVSEDYLQYETHSSSPELEHGTFNVLFTGLLTVGGIASGLQRFLDQAWPTVLSELPDARLTVLGRGASKQLRRRIEGLPNVRIVEWVADYKATVSQADAVVFPDRSGTGIKTRVLYAMALSRAVIASPLALEGIRAVDGEHCLRCDSPGEFARALLDVWRQPALRMRMGRSARTMIREHYNTTAIGERWANLYKQASDSRSSS